MPKWVKLLTNVTYQGHEVLTGDTIKLPDKSADALVANGEAKYTERGDSDTDEKTPSDPNKGGDGSGGTNGPSNEQKSPDGQGAPDDERTKLAKAIDAKYNRDELATKAQEIGVEFGYSDAKYQIVAAVIDQGKAEAILGTA